MGWVCGLATCGMMASVAGVAQEKGTWRPQSTTAKAITGPVVFSDERLSINFSTFAIAQIRDLKPEETAAAFSGAGDVGGRGELYRLSIPAAKVFLHKNTLCGGEDTQWMATYVTGKNLQVAFFSGAQMPVVTAEAMANTTALCGTFSYMR